jgi:hypothetical protein
MSTKFRQSFVRLCSGCRTSSKGQRTSAVLFCKGYATRPISINGNRNGTISSTGKLPYRPTSIHQFQERKMLLTDNTPTPVTATTIDTTKFIFP